jgi:hypothetical protein
MLRALLSREVIDDSTCARCSGRAIGKWRCKDCTAAEILCRRCMRENHMASPLHRVEVWNGLFFRPAALWETGVYILIKHHLHDSGTSLCDTLTFQRNFLERYHRGRDDVEQEQVGQEHVNPSGSDSASTFTVPNVSNEGESFEKDARDDVRFERRMDALYGDVDGREMDDDDEEGEDDTVDAPSLPSDYMPDGTFNGPQSGTQSWPRPSPNDATPSTVGEDIPHGDSLNNPYVRVVHTNGIHHLALVHCNCQGPEVTHCDIMAQSLIPTSFTRYRTLFTHAVLDDFRITNLECKASAYQYFQKIKRHTSSMFPDTVPNLYHELRRMSRLWRWMKKLKWAGFGHRTEETTKAEPGELANFCPACPQPGINISQTWHLDPQRYVIG